MMNPSHQDSIIQSEQSMVDNLSMKDYSVQIEEIIKIKQKVRAQFQNEPKSKLLEHIENLSVLLSKQCIQIEKQKRFMIMKRMIKDERDFYEQL